MPLPFGRQRAQHRFCSRQPLLMFVPLALRETDIGIGVERVRLLLRWQVRTPRAKKAPYSTPGHRHFPIEDCRGTVWDREPVDTMAPPLFERPSAYMAFEAHP